MSDSMSCSMRNEQNLCEMKIFQLKSMSNAIRWIDQRFTFKTSGISCLALIFNLSNLRATILHSRKRVVGCETRQDGQVIYQYINDKIIIWIYCQNTSWYPWIHRFSWIHYRYHGFWPLSFSWKKSYSNLCLYRQYSIVKNVLKSIVISRKFWIEFSFEFIVVVGGRTVSDGASPSSSCCSRATCLTITFSVWQSYSANTCHLGLITHSVLAARAAQSWI